MLFAIIFLLMVAPSNLTPLMVVRSFPSGEQGNVVNLAILEVSFSVGMVVGGILVATLAAQWDRIRLIVGSSLVFGGLSIALGLAPNLLGLLRDHAADRARGAVLLDALDDAATGDRGAGTAGPRVRLRRDRDGGRDAVRDGRLRPARGRGAGSRRSSSAPGWRRSWSSGSRSGCRRGGGPSRRRMPRRLRRRVDKRRRSAEAARRWIGIGPSSTGATTDDPSPLQASEMRARMGELVCPPAKEVERMQGPR